MHIKQLQKGHHTYRHTTDDSRERTAIVAMERECALVPLPLDMEVGSAVGALHTHSVT